MIRHIKPDKDTRYTKLFVGGIPYDTDDESLRQYFIQFGEIEEAVVILDRDKKSRGYGFVTMLNREDAAKACENKRPNIDGRIANVNLAYLGAKPKSFTKGFNKSTSPLQLSYGQNFTMSGQQMGYPPIYSQAPIQTSSTIQIVPNAPTNGVSPAHMQPLYITDLNGIPTLVFGQVYDPLCFSTQAQGYLPSPSTPVSSFTGPAFTFPTVDFQGPPTPPSVNGSFNGQQFFQPGIEAIPQPILHPLPQQ